MVGFGSAGLASFGGRTALEVCSDEWVGLGYTIRAIRINHDVFADIPRERLFLIGVSKQAGHSRAAEWMVDFLASALSQQRMSAPLSVWDVVQPDGHDERSRRPQVEDLLLFMCCIGIACFIRFINLNAFGAPSLLLQHLCASV